MDQRTIPGRRPVIVTLALALTGCGGVQSALDPASDDAAGIHLLSSVLFIGGGAIFAVVMALLALALFAPDRWRGWLGGRSTIVIGGLAFPIVTLSALLPYGLIATRNTDVRAADALRIEVVGEQYWWRVRYPADGDRPAFATANELMAPIGRPVTVTVTSADVIHSFWIPNFGGKIDMIPGRANTLSFTAERPGIYRGVCAEFCGDQHARMAFDVVALEPAAFAAWRAAQAQAASEPPTPVLAAGQELFRRGGCGTCHAVRGTAANGNLGPDLTHIGSRRTIAAGQFPNNVGTLAGWIANTQQLKPGVRMPSYGMFAGEDLRALAAYLESLK